MFDLFRDIFYIAWAIVFCVVMGFFALIFSIFDTIKEIVSCILQPIPIGPFILICLMALAIALPLGYIYSKVTLHYFKKHPEMKRPAWVEKKLGPSDHHPRP